MNSNLWITSWFTWLPIPLGHIVMALTAVLGGWIIGGERERHEKPAGLRTLIMVCLGATIFTMISVAFTTTTGDSGRVAAQIVTGIGFLGAGVIIHSRGSVTGATTAATIWTTAAIGIVIGAGYVPAGLGLALLVRAVLGGIWMIEQHLLGHRVPWVLELAYDPDHGKTRIHINKMLQDFHVHQPVEELGSVENGPVRIRVQFRLLPGHRHDLLSQLADLTSVMEIRDFPESSSPSQ